MGVLVGNYIHLNWENYLNKGINKWGDSPEKVTETIFSKHQEHIQQLAQKYKVQNLGRIQQEYNTRNTLQYEQFKRIQNSSKLTEREKQLLLYRLVKSLSPTDKNQKTTWSSKLIQDIANNLYFDDVKKTVVYRKNTSSVLSASQTQLQSVNYSKIGSAEHYRRVDSLISRCEELISSIANNTFLDIQDKNYYISSIKNNIINPVISIHANLSTPIKGDINKILGTIPLSLANGYYDKLDQIKRDINGIQKINEQLQAKFAEVLGNLIGDSAYKAGIVAVYDTLKKGVQGDLYTSKNLTNNNALTLDLDLDVLKKTRLTESGTYVDKNNQLRALWTFDGVGNDVQQKADASFTITLDGTTSTHGISLKNTNFIKEINKQSEEDWGNFIEVQTSSPIILYLLGMNDYGPGIANHYLNIFTKHPDLKDYNTALHKTAIESFKIAILYSALTGRQQLRKGGFADILAIYDKGNNGIFRVKLFDISDIIDSAISLGANQVAKFHVPEKEKDFLQNDKEINENNTIKENQNIRVTKVLLETRKKHVATYISKQYLNKVVKHRGF